MGPRSTDRGKASRRRAPPSPGRSLQWSRDQLIAERDSAALDMARGAGLQWGRDQLIAESATARTKPSAHVWLQWGRDQLIAESGIGFSVLGFINGFNGAAIN